MNTESLKAAKAVGDGGFPAFPTAGGANSGMTLRDYFAANAMQALIARVPYDQSHHINWGSLSTAAYMWADAMLRARKEQS